MAGSINQVELVFLAVLRQVLHAHRMGLDGDAALPLQVHGVQHLLLHLPHGKRSCQLQEPVRERGFAMIDVRDDGKVADVFLFHVVLLPAVFAAATNFSPPMASMGLA